MNDCNLSNGQSFKDVVDVSFDMNNKNVERMNVVSSSPLPDPLFLLSMVHFARAPPIPIYFAH